MEKVKLGSGTLYDKQGNEIGEVRDVQFEPTPQKQYTLTLMNLGDGPRIIYNSKMQSVNFAVGQTRTITMNEPTYKRFMKHIGSDNMLILPDGSNSDPRVMELVGLLQGFDRREYDEVLTLVENLIGRDPGNPRPSKSEMRAIVKSRLHEIQLMVNASGVDSESIKALTDALLTAGRQPVDKDAAPEQTDETSPKGEGGEGGDEGEDDKDPNEMSLEDVVKEFGGGEDEEGEGDKEGEQPHAEPAPPADEPAMETKAKAKAKAKKARVRVR